MDTPEERVFERIKNLFKKNAKVIQTPLRKSVLCDTFPFHTDENGLKMSKNSIIKINLKILRGLAKLPMTTYEVKEYVGCSYDTAKKNLSYLEKLGKVEQVHLKSYDPEAEKDKILWQLKKPKR